MILRWTKTSVSQAPILISVPKSDAEDVMKMQNKRIDLKL